MNPHILRAQLLLAQDRFDQAEREVGQALMESPDDAYTHALLAVCLKGRRKYREAEQAAGRAVALDPGLAFAHYVLGHAHGCLHRWAEAEAAIRSAIELDPSEPDHFHVLSEIRFRCEDWAGAAGAAEQGLAFDAQHAGCLNSRAMALTKLGRSDEAAQTIEGALADNPEDPYSHLTRGWTALHQSDADKALEHFREALRLKPDLESAREGMVLALKARYRVYRVLLQFFLWMHTRGRRFRWFVVVSLFVVQQSLWAVARNWPGSGSVLWPILYLMFAFAAVTWLADPLFNLTLRLNRYGRHAVSKDDRALAVWVGFLLAAAIIGVVYIAIFSTVIGEIIPITPLFAAILVSAVYRFRTGWRRCAAAAFTVALVMAYLMGINNLYAAAEAEQAAYDIEQLDQRERDAATAAGQDYHSPRARVAMYRLKLSKVDNHLDRLRVLMWGCAAGVVGLLVASQAAPGGRSD